MVRDDRGRQGPLAGVAVSAVHITRDLRRPDGTGWQQGVKDGWHVAREFAREVLAYDADTMAFTFAPGPAEPGPWCYNVTGFTNRPDWPTHPDFDGNCGHVARADGTTSPVRMFGRKLFVTPRGTENWSH